MKTKNIIRKIRFILEYIAVIAIFRITRLLPHKLLFTLSSAAGWVMFHLSPMGKVASANVASAFPEKTRIQTRKIARESIGSIVQSLLEFFWFTERPEKLEKYVTFGKDVEEMIQKCEETGEGFILVTPHLGNWELAGMIMSHFANIKFAVVAKKIRNPYLGALVNSTRMIDGNKVIDAKGAVKGMIRALKEGFAMATLIDQNTKARNGGIFVNFFGMQVPTSRAPALFGRRLNIPVAVGGCVRNGRKYETFLSQIPREKVENYTSDEELIQELMKLTEEQIREYPEQYLWFYKRFQHIPQDADEESIKNYPFYAQKVTPRFYSNNAPKT